MYVYDNEGAVINDDYKQLVELGEKWDVLGVVLGGCVNNLNLKFRRASAHAHDRGRSKGFICAPDSSKLIDLNGNPTTTWLHEIAHLRCPQQVNGGHGRKWCRTAVELGVPEHEIWQYLVALDRAKEKASNLVVPKGEIVWTTKYGCDGFKVGEGCKLGKDSNGEWHGIGHDDTEVIATTKVIARRELMHKNHGWFLKGCPDCERTNNGWHKE